MYFIFFTFGYSLSETKTFLLAVVIAWSCLPKPCCGHFNSPILFSCVRLAVKHLWTGILGSPHGCSELFKSGLQSRNFPEAFPVLSLFMVCFTFEQVLLDLSHSGILPHHVSHSGIIKPDIGFLVVIKMFKSTFKKYNKCYPGEANHFKKKNMEALKQHFSVYASSPNSAGHDTTS